MNTGKRSAIVQVDNCRVEFTYAFYDSFLHWSMRRGTYSLDELITLLNDQKVEYVFHDNAGGTPAVQSPTLNMDAHARQVGGDHYKNLAVEPWKAMKSWLTQEEFIGFLRGNIIKYHARANSGKGTREENLAKAAHYQQALTEYMEGTSPTTDTPN